MEDASNEYKSEDTIKYNSEMEVNCSTNPHEADLINENGDLQLIRGDAIGDTMYSERFVLKVLIQLGKITKDLEEEPDIEKNLCSLWDMTAEPDVIKYLLEYDILEVFSEVLKSTNDKRLTEILIGILANMCYSEKVREIFYTENTSLLNILLDLSGCSDTPTLEQLMRLWSMLFNKCPNEYTNPWYNKSLVGTNLIENICYILNNAIAPNVLKQTMDTILNIVIACDYNEGNIVAETFVNPEIIRATVEAFKTLMNDNEWCTNDNNNNIKTFNMNFCNFHARLSDYQNTSQCAYESYNTEMLWCLRKILQRLWEENSISIIEWDTYQIEIIRTCNDILKILPEPFDKYIVSYLIQIWRIIKKEFCVDEMAQDVFELIVFCISTCYKLKGNSGNELLKEMNTLLSDTDRDELVIYLDQNEDAVLNYVVGNKKFAQFYEILKNTIKGKNSDD